MKRIVVATKNQGKMREIKAILGDTGYEFVSMGELGINIDVVEDADTFLGNAEKKAVEIMKACGEITLADDSGLCVEALGGAPGVYSARYSGEGATDLKNNLLLLKNMEGVENRKAYFACAMVVAFPDGKIISHCGEFHGEIDYENLLINFVQQILLQSCQEGPHYIEYYGLLRALRLVSSDS